jgi:tetratricopeptide (TPR) repeat protein
MDVAFGRDADDRKRPFDVRIHRQLGDLYSWSGRSDYAARQFQLARKLAPRDIFLLRRLGKAHLDQKDFGSVAEIIREMEALDKDAFTRNIENAAFKARYLEATGNLLGAKDVLTVAFNTPEPSYYLGDLLGQVLLDLGETDQAQQVYRQVSRIISDLREQNVWTWATMLSAALVCNDAGGLERALTGLRAARPARGELESIERGVIKICNALKRDPQIVSRLRDIEGSR